MCLPVLVFDTRLHVSAALAGLSVKVMPVCIGEPMAGLKFEKGRPEAWKGQTNTRPGTRS